MTENEGLKRVFLGSNVDGSFIKSILEDNGISCLLRDSLMESATAGWASGSTENSCSIFVEESNEATAKELIEQYKSSLDNN